MLGFEEYLPPRSSRHSSAPLSEDEFTLPISSPAPLPPPATRPRSPSDPFLDTPAPLLSPTTSTSRSRFDESSEQSTQPSPSPSFSQNRTAYPGKKLLDLEEDSFDGEPHMRMWTSADLDNPELQSLISLFPDFITRQILPRFPPARSNLPDLEGQDMAVEGKDVTCGTGRMFVGDKQRREGWKGSWWHRFTGWWRRLFR